jgi:Ca2+-binding RTX toxin-like protein
MANPSNQEQLLLEYINHTRLNPLGNAARYISNFGPQLTSPDAGIQNALNFFRVSGTALQTALTALTPTQPLAWSTALHDAATGHSQVMVATNSQTHQAPGEPGLGQRAVNAGYASYSTLAENVFAYADSMLDAHAAFMVDWGNGPNGMQNPAGHRIAIMNASYREVGVAAVPESNPATAVGPWVVTENYGNRFNAPQVFLLGVSYRDNDLNAFYTPGEGRSGININASGTNGQTTSSGGYTMELTAGNKTITFSGGDLAAPLVVSAALSTGTNAKLDVVDANTIQTSVSLTLISGATKLVALGVSGLQLVGNALAEQLIGNQGSNVLLSLGGNDQAFGGDGLDYLYGGEGEDTLNGDKGDDVLFGEAGHDVLVGGEGADYIDGGAGFDYADGGAGNDIFLMGAGNDTAVGQAGNDYFDLGEDSDYADGGAGDDIFLGGRGDDVFVGDLGVDYFDGGSGNDYASGGDGNDIFLGGEGHDTFESGTGLDVAVGGAGSDSYIVRASNGVLVVYDFLAGGAEDALLLASDTGITTFSQAQARLAFNASSNASVLTIDADTSVWLVGVNNAQLTAADFAFV